MDRSDLQRTGNLFKNINFYIFAVESLRHQLRIQRVPISRSGAELKTYIEQHQPNDPLVNPVEKAR